MASEPVYMHHPDMITLRQAEAIAWAANQVK